MARAFVAASSERLYAAQSLITAEPLTMACWVKLRTGSPTRELISLDDSAGSAWHSLRTQGTEARATSYDGAFAYDPKTTLSDETWHHIAGVWSSSSSRVCYLDGAAGLGDATSRTVTGINQIELGAVTFGGSPANFGDHDQAESAVWSAALTQAEITMLASGVSPMMIRPASLVIYAPTIRSEDRDTFGGLSFSSGGTPDVSSHPRVIYPTRPQIIAAQAGTPPTATFKGLTLLGVGGYYG